MIPTRILVAAFALPVLAACATMVVRSDSGSSQMPIADARRLPLASPVVVEGVVTVPSGTFDDGFAIQDGDAGIYVYASAAERRQRGERVRVAGRLKAENQLLGIEPGTVEVLGRDAPPRPRILRTADIGAATEGLMVEIHGTVTGAVVDDSPWGWKLYVDDGSGPVLVFLDAQSGVRPDGIAPGKQVYVMGFSGRYDEHFEVLPTAPWDIGDAPRSRSGRP